jgi:GAF domain-containing protein
VTQDETPTDRPTRQTFALIAERLRQGRTVEDTYRAISEAAITLIDGCDHAGIGVLDRGRFTTAAANDHIVEIIDGLQREAGEGPCLEASVEEMWQLDNDLTQDAQWPALAKLVTQQTPVRSALALPLVHEGRRSGALNLFADRPGVFDEQATETAAILAAFASVAIVAAQQRQRADELQEGLETNREIGAAVGMLMASHNVSADEAFALLSQASQRLNRKLRDLAADMVRRDRSQGR